MPNLASIGKALANLKADKASRMARAKEQGFDTDTPYYHGTNADFDKFKKDTRGNATGSKSAKKAFFFSDSPRTAQSYAHNTAVNVPVQNIIKQADEAGNRGDWDGYDALLEKAEDLEKSLNANRANGQNIIPTYLPGTDDLREINMRGRSFDDFGVSDEIDEHLTSAQRDGLKGVRFSQLNDSAGLSNDPSNHIAMFDPSNIRSVNAMFDPAKKDSSNLLASAAGAGILGAGAMQSEDAEASFIGQAANTFSGPSLKLAKELEALGAGRDAIWDATGKLGAPMMKGVDGEWRQEISDHNATIPADSEKWFREQGGTDLGALFDHDELFNAYPNLNYRGVKLSDDDDYSGSYSPRFDRFQLDKSLDSEGIKSVGMHEVQHAIQQREGFAKGSNIESAQNQINTVAAQKELNDSSLKSWRNDLEINLKKAGYDDARALSDTAWRLEEIDRLKGYLKDYHNGGNLTDKRRHILNSGGSIVDVNIESRMRNEISWPKRHRPKNERNAAYADYIGRIVSEAEGALDEQLVNTVKAETVKRPYSKYQRQMDKARKEVKPTEDFVNNRRKRGNELAGFLDQYPKDGFRSGRKLYRATAGEVESRTVQERLDMTPQERIDSPPWLGDEWRETPEQRQVVVDDRGNLLTYGGSFKNLRDARKQLFDTAPMSREVAEVFANEKSRNLIRDESELRKTKTFKWRKKNPPSPELAEASKRGMPGIGRLTPSELRNLNQSPFTDLISAGAAATVKEIATLAAGVWNPNKAEDMMESEPWFKMGDQAQGMYDAGAQWMGKNVAPTIGRGINAMLDYQAPLSPTQTSLREDLSYVGDQYGKTPEYFQKEIAPRLVYAAGLGASVYPGSQGFKKAPVNSMAPMIESGK